MTILHIAALDERKYSGICNVVPIYVINQQKREKTALLNILDCNIPGIENLFYYSGFSSVSSLPVPFNRPDIVVFHDVYIMPFIKLYPQLLKQNIPYVIVPHGGLSVFAQKKKFIRKKAANLLLFNRFIANASGIHCLSENEKQNSLRFLKNYFVIPNGVDVPVFDKEYFKNNSVSMIYIGRFEYYIKGLDILLNALGLIRSFLVANNVKVNLYGPDIDNSVVLMKKVINEQNLHDIVCIHDAVYGKEKDTILKNADYFIQTSRTEAMPMGILEAMAYKLPCIITKGTSLAETVEQNDCGFTANTDVQSLANIIKQAVESRDGIPQKGLNAYNLIKKSFAWESLTGQTLVEYAEILKKT